MGRRKQITASVISHRGCERGNNEDNFFFNGDYMAIEAIDSGAWISADFRDSVQLFAVCDGMGGAQYGERASTMTVRKMVSLLVQTENADADTLVDAFCHEASDEVFEDSQKRNAKYQGTTLAMVLLKRNHAHIYNVGDSRVYLLRDKKIKQLSEDHSEVGRLLRSGYLTADEARKHPRNNVITQYIGMGPNEKPTDLVFKRRVSIFRKDRLLLCSDGITDLISDTDILGISKGCATAHEFAKHLTLRAMEMSGKDNMTSIALDIVRGYPLPKNQ